MMFALPAILQQGGETIDPLQPRFCGFNKTPTFPEYELVADPSLVDPYWNNNILYLTGVGTNGSQSFVDSSVNPKTLTVTGATAYSSAQSKYNGSSVFSDAGTNYITVGYAGTLSTFTVEYWFYFNANANGAVCNIFGNVTNFSMQKTADNFLRVAIALDTTLRNIKVPLLKWNHVAVTRVGTTRRVFFNGYLVDERTVSGSNITFSNNLRLGQGMRGYLSNFRITKDVDRYSGYFNPETATYMATATGGTTTIDYYTW